MEVKLRPLGGGPLPISRPSVPPVGPPEPASREAAPETRGEPEPRPREPGQADPGSWEYVAGLARAHPALAVVLALMAITALSSLLRGDLISTIVGGAILWGVLTFQWWGYFIALGLSGLGVVFSVGIIGVAIAKGFGADAAIAFGPALAVCVLTIVVLWRRRDLFA